MRSLAGDAVSLCSAAGDHRRAEMSMRLFDRLQQVRSIALSIGSGAERLQQP